MEESKKEERHKQLNEFILKCLKERPLSPSQILKKIQEEKDSKGKSTFRVNTLIGLRKDHLKDLEKKYFIFRLDKKDIIEYGKIADPKTYKISSKDFLEKFWFKWEKGAEKNYFHVYYFATPLTYKWEKILDKVIKEVEKRLDIFLGKERIAKIKDTFKKLIESMQKVELFPKNKKIKSKNLFYKSFSEKEFKEVKKKMFGFDIIEHDFSRHFSRHFSHKIIPNKIFRSLFHELMHYQEKLHRLIFVNPKIEIENILEVI